MSGSGSDGSEQEYSEFEAQYGRLLRQTEARVEGILGQLGTWRSKGSLDRLMAWGERPPSRLPQRLADDIATLMSWADQLSKMRKRLDDRQRARIEEAKRMDEARRADEARRLDELRAWGRKEEQRIRQLLDAHVQEVKERRSRTVAEARQFFDAVVAASDVSARAWDDPLWLTAMPPEQAGADVRIGRFTIDAPEPASALEAPAALSFPFATGLFIDGAPDARVSAVGLARSVCLRLLAAVSAGKLHFTFIDPVAYGESVADFQHLADFDKRLVGRPATSTREIEERLADLSAHVETVISDHLRGQFASIDEYNKAAGEITEPYRVLVVFDYPAEFSKQAAQQLQNLTKNGPRCGVHVIAVTDPTREQPRDLPLLQSSQHRVSWTGTPVGGRARLDVLTRAGLIRHDIVPDTAPPILFDRDKTPRSAAASLLVKVGELAEEAADSQKGEHDVGMPGGNGIQVGDNNTQYNFYRTLGPDDLAEITDPAGSAGD